MKKLIVYSSALLLMAACAPKNDAPAPAPGPQAGHHSGHHGQMNQSHKHNYESDHLNVGMGWVRAVPPNAKTSAAYMHIMTKDMQPDMLLSASSDVAENVELHNVTTDEAGMMMMRPVESIPVSSDTPTMLKPGSYHIMLIGLKAPLEEGQMVDLTLNFKTAGEVKITIPVKAMTGGPMKHGGNHGGHHGMNH